MSSPGVRISSPPLPRHALENKACRFPFCRDSALDWRCFCVGPATRSLAPATPYTPRRALLDSPTACQADFAARRVPEFRISQMGGMLIVLDFSLGRVRRRLVVRRDRGIDSEARSASWMAPTSPTLPRRAPSRLAELGCNAGSKKPETLNGVVARSDRQNQTRTPRSPINEISYQDDRQTPRRCSRPRPIFPRGFTTPLSPA